MLCTASVDERVPPFMKNSGLGWVTAEYGMLPRATNTRMRREAKEGQSGRTQEIQRLIGRSLRAGVDRVALGERQIVVDCDVIQADGGTRCAAITGGWVALRLAVNKLMKAGLVLIATRWSSRLRRSVAGSYAGQAVLDLDYPEDSEAGVDGNFVMTGIETDRGADVGRRLDLHPDQMMTLLELAEKGVAELVAAQKAAVA